MTELNQSDRDLFRRAIGVWNCPDLKTASASAQLDQGDDILNDPDIATVREAFAAVVQTHGQPGYSRSLDRRELHVWGGVQMAKGRGRGNLFFMEFEGVAAGYFTGEAA